MTFDTKELERIIDDVNKKFISTVKEQDHEDKIMLQLFKEKFIHFLLYKQLKQEGWNAFFEYPTDLKIMRTGKKPRSGDHDIVLLDDDSQTGFIPK